MVVLSLSDIDSTYENNPHFIVVNKGETYGRRARRVTGQIVIHVE